MPFKFTPSDAIQVIRDTFNLDINLTGFDTVVTETPVNQIDVNASHPANTGSIRLLTGGTVDDFTGDFSAVSQFTDREASYEISTNGNDGDFTICHSAEAGRYIPGYESISAASFNISEPLDDNHVVQTGYGIFNEADGSIEDGFYYEFSNTERKMVLRKGGQTVLEIPSDEWEKDPFTTGELDEFTPSVFRNFFNWYGAGNVRSIFSFTDPEGNQDNDRAAKLFNQDGYLTDEINLHMFTKIKCEGDADSPSSVNAGSMEYKVRGEATASQRKKASHEFGVTGGNISGDLTGIKVLRIDPSVQSVTNEFLEIEISPTDDMQVAAVAVDRSQLTLSDADFETPNLLSSDNNIIQEAPYSTIDQTEIPANVDDMSAARQLALSATQSGGKAGTETTDDEVSQFFTRFEYVVFVAKTDGSTGADTDLKYEISEGF